MKSAGSPDPIERRAHAVLEQNDAFTVPVPIEGVLAAEGVLLARNQHAGIESSFALRESGRRIIGVNTATSPRRQRFAVAHGLGHLLLHDMPITVCQSVRTEPVHHRRSSSGVATDDEEFAANRFAAALLMPRDLLIADLAERLGVGDFASRDELIQRMARRFEVSLEAMGWWLLSLSLTTG